MGPAARSARAEIDELYKSHLGSDRDTPSGGAFGVADIRFRGNEMTSAVLPSVYSDRTGGVRWWWYLVVLGGVLATVHALVFVFGTTPGNTTAGGELLAQQKARMFATSVVGYAHTLGGAFASVIGPFQFLASFRRRFPSWHVWAGRVYLTCVGASALAGLYLAPNSNARNTLGIAFIALALAWLYTGWNAYSSIRRRNVQAHRRWMIRNYALTFAAVTLRIEIPLLVMVGMSGQTALDIIGWGCWVPNLLLVEYVMRRQRRHDGALAVTPPGVA